MAVFEIQNPPAVAVTAGGLRVLSSGTVNFAPDAGFKASVGAITIEMVFQNSEQGQPEILRKPLPESLTFQYLIKGAIPNSPAGMGLKYPEAIGTANGTPIHFSFSLSVLANDQKAIVLSYAVYASAPGSMTPEASHAQ